MINLDIATAMIIIFTVSIVIIMIVWAVISGGTR